MAIVLATILCKRQINLHTRTIACECVSFHLHTFVKLAIWKRCCMRFDEITKDTSFRINMLFWLKTERRHEIYFFLFTILFVETSQLCTFAELKKCAKFYAGRCFAADETFDDLKFISSVHWVSCLIASNRMILQHRSFVWLQMERNDQKLISFSWIRGLSRQSPAWHMCFGGKTHTTCDYIWSPVWHNCAHTNTQTHIHMDFRT